MVDMIIGLYILNKHVVQTPPFNLLLLNLYLTLRTLTYGISEGPKFFL